MRKEIFIVSNNERVWATHPCRKVEGDLDQVFQTLRDLVHGGCRVLTHPLAGSVKPHETEFKSVILEKRIGPVDPASLELIENAIAVAARFKRPHRDWGKDAERIQDDFKAIDASLLETGLDGLGLVLHKLVI